MNRPRACYRQRNSFDCGPGAMMTVLVQVGVWWIGFGRLKAWSGTNSAGTRLSELKKAAERAGIKSELWQGTLADVSQNLLPAVAPISNALGRWHFCVLEKVGASHVTIADPARGRMRVPCDVFTRRWSTGVLLVLGDVRGIALTPPEQRCRACELLTSLMSERVRPAFGGVLCSLAAAVLPLVMLLVLRLYVSAARAGRVEHSLTLVAVLLGCLLLQSAFAALNGFLSRGVRKRVEDDLMMRFPTVSSACRDGADGSGSPRPSSLLVRDVSSGVASAVMLPAAITQLVAVMSVLLLIAPVIALFLMALIGLITVWIWAPRRAPQSALRASKGPRRFVSAVVCCHAIPFLFLSLAASRIADGALSISALIVGVMLLRSLVDPLPRFLSFPVTWSRAIDCLTTIAARNASSTCGVEPPESDNR